MSADMAYTSLMATDTDKSSSAAAYAAASVAASISNITVVLAIVTLIVLCAGDPDLLDAIIANVKAQAVCR